MNSNPSEPNSCKLEEIDIPHIDKIVDVTFKERLVELDSYWLLLFPELRLYRYIYDDRVRILEPVQPLISFYQPLILIHGYQSSHNTWNWFVLQLWLLGFRNIFAMEMKNYALGLESLYDQLDSVINKVQSILPDCSSIAIIGHSLGGIIARYYLKHTGHQKKTHIALCITLASPHYGLLKSLKRFESIIKKIIVPETVDIFSPVTGIHLETVQHNQNEEFFKTTLVNIQGSLKRYAGSDGTFKPAPVSEMINYIVPVSHFSFNKSDDVFAIVKSFLIYQVPEPIIFKFRLLKLKFLKFHLGDFFKCFFTISIDSGKEQRYPLLNELKIFNKELLFTKPQIVYAGITETNESHKMVTISVFTLDASNKTSLLLSSSFTITLASKRPLITFETLENDQVFATFNVLTYKIGQQV